MIQLEKNERDQQMSVLMKEMRDFEHQEVQGTQALSKQYSMVDGQVEDLFKVLQDDQDRLASLEKLIVEGQRESRKIIEQEAQMLLKQQKINAQDQNTLAPNALKDGKIDAVDPSTLAPNALKDQD